MDVYVDVDETICDYDLTGPREYHLARPIKINIDKINKLYEEGNSITYWTARGSVSGIDFYELTHSQLLKWGAKFHNLIVGKKPAYDLLICDKSKRIEEL